MVSSNHTDASDSELLREFVRDGAERAFATLVARHVDLVYSAALRQVGGDPHRAEEVTQMVFGDLAKKAASLASHPSLAGWLYTGARWAARKVLRAERRRAKYENAAAEQTATTTPNAENIDWNEVRPVLDEAMNKLSEAEREAVLLRFFNNCSFADVGTRLGLEDNTARMRVQRALEKLRAQLARRGVTSSAGALGAALTANAVSAAPPTLAATTTTTALSGATAAASALTISGILIMTKATAVIIGIGILALGYFVVSQTTQQNALASEVLDAKNKSETLRRELADQQAQKQRLVDEVAHVRSLIAAVPNSEAKLKEARNSDLTSRSREDTTYPALYRKLHLDPDKLATLRELMRLRMRTRARAERMAAKVNLADNTEVVDFAQQDVDNRIRELIGDENFEYFKFYMDTEIHRTPGQFGRFLSYLNIPLSDEQMDRIVTINDTLGADSLRRSLDNGIPRVWTDAEIQAAEKVLSPAQFMVLQDCNRTADADYKLAEYNRAAFDAGLIKSKTLEQLLKETRNTR